MVHQGGRDRPPAPLPRGGPDYARKQAAFEEDVIVSKGYLATSSSSPTSSTGPSATASASVRARLRGRLDVRLRDGHHRPRPRPARPHLRALPQPRAPRRPTSTSTSTSAGAARSSGTSPRSTARSGRPDRHLRHDQGQAGRQGREPRARPPVLDGREADQGDAARDHGQGHPARRHLRPGAQALQRGGDFRAVHDEDLAPGGRRDGRASRA